MQEKAAVASKTETAGVLETVLQQTIEARPDLALLQIENESIRTECRLYPRDFKRIKAELSQLLEDFPDFAREAIYKKPVGTVTYVECKCGHSYECKTWKIDECPKCGKVQAKRTEKRKKFAEGLSIKAAQALAEAYRFNRVRCDVIPLDLQHSAAKVEAVFVNLQNGRVWQDAGTITRKYKSSKGETEEIPLDRFYGTICKGEASKRIRECIVRSVNPALKEWFEDLCRTKLEAVLESETIDKILKTFAPYGAKQKDLEKLVGRTRAMGWTVEDKVELLKAYSSLKNGECTLAELLADDEPSQTRLPAGSSPTEPTKRGLTRRMPAWTWTHSARRWGSARLPLRFSCATRHGRTRAPPTKNARPSNGNATVRLMSCGPRGSCRRS